MDNLILKTINFLFVPEAALAVVFLIVFIILCIYGYLKVKKCKLFIMDLEQNMEAEFDKCKDKYNPHTFISGKLAAISGIENEVMQIPNIFVSIGILATFLGLGVAIQSAAALLKSNTVELAKLNDVLGIIAFKFQTSVWGIMFSLLFQKIIVNTYFEFKENIVSAMHEKLYEKVRAGIHKTLDEQNGLLEQQIELQKETQQLNQNNMDSLQNLTKEHMDSFAAMMQANMTGFANIMQQSFDKFNQTMQDNFSNYNSSMNDSMQKFSNLTEDYRAISEQFAQNVNNFANETNAQNKLRSQQLAEFNDNLETQKNYLDSQMERFIQNLQDTQEKANESNRDAVLSFNESVKAMEQRFVYNENEYAKQTQDRLGEALDKHLRMISDETICQCRAVSKTVDTLDDTISKAVNMLDATLNVTDEKMSSLQNVVIDFKKTQKQLIEDSALISDNNTKLVASINETQLKNEKLLQDTLEEVKQLLQTQQADNKDLFLGIVEKQNEDAAANINTIIRQLNNNKQSYDSKIGSLLNLLSGKQQEFNDNLASVDANVTKCSENLLELSNYIKNASTETSDLREQFVSRIIKAINNAQKPKTLNNINNLLVKQNELLEGCAENLGVKREELSVNLDKKNNGEIGESFLDRLGAVLNNETAK